MHKLIDDIQRLRTKPTKEELDLTLEVIDEIKDSDLVHRVNKVIEWCQANIEDQTDVTTFASQVRDCLEGK